MKNFRQQLWKAAFAVLTAILLIYLLFPFYWAVISSLKAGSQLIMTPATLLPRDPGSGAVKLFFGNYTAVFRNRIFMMGFINSLFVSGSVTILALLFGAFAAFSFGKLNFKGKTLSFYLILSMTMFPQISVLSGLYAVIRTLEIPARFSMVLSYMIFTLPFTIWVLSAFFKGIPQSLLEASVVDGSSMFQAFRMILLPLSAPALVTTGLLSFIAAWNEYLFALTFTTIQRNARTVPVAIALFGGEISRQEPFGEIMAASVLVTVPLLVLVLIFQNRIVEGLTAGAVKG